MRPPLGTGKLAGDLHSGFSQLRALIGVYTRNRSAAPELLAVPMNIAWQVPIPTGGRHKKGHERNAKDARDCRRRPALARFVPFSYFCTCSKVTAATPLRRVIL